MEQLATGYAVPLGRDRELASLAVMLDHAASGTGCALLIRGEAGIGKTALLGEARRDAARRDMLMLACSGVRSEADLPFAALHQLLRPVLPLVCDLPGGHGDLLRTALTLDPSVLADLHRVALATLELFTVATVRAPLLVLVDDAHWLDRPSADVLSFAARRIAADPVAMIIAVRDGTPDPFEGSGIPSLFVRPLDAAASGALIDGAAPGLAAGVRDRVLAEAAGNPLALTELAAAVPPGGMPDERLPVSDLLRRTFLTRVAELPAATMLLLFAASADRACSLGELRDAAATLHSGPLSEADIQPAMDASLVRLEGTRPVFCHQLTATAIYQSATVVDRQRIHAALARVTGTGDDRRRVWHLASAALGPDERVAAELEAVADQAARRGEIAFSLTAFDRAASLATDKAQRARLLLRSSECAAELGRGELAADLLIQADAAQPNGPSRMRALITRERVRSAPDWPDATVTDLVEAARAAHGEGERDLATSVLWAAASRCWWESAPASDRQAVTSATEAIGLPATDLRRVAVLSAVADTGRHADLHRDLLRGCDEHPGRTSQEFAAIAAENLGDYPLAIQLCAAEVRLARPQGRLGPIPRLQAIQAWAMLWAGDLASAAAAATESAAIADQQDQPMWRRAAELELMLISGLRGDYAQAREQADRWLANRENRDVKLLAAAASYSLSVAALGTGNYQEACDGLLKITNPASTAFHYGSRWWVTGDLAEAALYAGRVAETRELLADLAAEFREHPTPSVRYAVLYADAILATEDRTAAERFEAALAADPGGSPLAQARLQLAYGSWLRRCRRQREARTVLRQAGECFTSLGTTGFARQAARELRAAGETGRRPPVDGLPHPTAQELEIARLAATGLTNQEIGERLFLSHRTVGSHLYHLFPKLGITNRAQLASALQARDLDAVS